MDYRGLRDLRDGNRLGHKAAGFERGGGSRPSSRLQTASAWAAVRARREGLGWTASASEVAEGSESWTLEVYVTCATVRGPARKSAPGDGIQGGGGSRPSFVWADVVGIGGGGSTTGGAEVDGVSIKAISTERELDSRGLRHLRDGNRLAHKATAFKRGGGSRPSSRLQTASALAATRGRREPLGWTASASEVAEGSESWTLEVYVTCATVRGPARKSAPGDGIQEGRRKPPLFAFADGFGIGSGARKTGAAGVDGLGVGAISTERALDSRGLRDLRDGNRLGHKATAFERGGGSRQSLRGQRSSVSAA